MNESNRLKWNGIEKTIKITSLLKSHHYKNNTKIAINIHVLELFALLLVFSYQFTANCLSLPVANST